MSIGSGRVCAVPGCDLTTIARGWCRRHYDMKRVRVRPRKARRIRLCEVVGCGQMHYGRGGCREHYSRSEESRIAQAAFRTSLEYKAQQTEYRKQAEVRARSAEAGTRYRTSPHGRAAHAAGESFRRAIACGVGAELVTMDYLIERDRGICGLCGLSVEGHLTWPHPMSSSMDHIVPLSRGGLHTKVNLQLAHLGCNIRKGNRPAAMAC
jgi:hypothetical protein